VLIFNRKLKLNIVLLLMVSFGMLLTGCKSSEAIKVRFGWKNLDFEYIKENQVDKIIIQSTRDAGFRFIVTDKRTIRDLYEILSSARQSEEQSSLEPDYIFEMYQSSGEVHKFKYIAGIEKREIGNLYSEDKVYIVSKRIDNDIIRNLWNIRKPREFGLVYYKSILAVLQEYGKEINTGERIGINLLEDIDIAKYILSTDLEDFKKSLKAVMNNAELVDGNKEDFDVLVTVKTYGYKSDIYKAIIHVESKKEKTEKRYWIMNRHENGEWSINPYDKRPDNF
jgi:hypothetical protein